MMQKAVFFSGTGTAYSGGGSLREGLEVYSATWPALRFLNRRGYTLVHVTPEWQEYKSLISSSKDKTISIIHYNSDEQSLNQFPEYNGINLHESYLITDGLSLKIFQGSGCRIILVLTGRGFCTLTAQEEKEISVFSDVCKDIYAAAFSIALSNCAPIL